MAEKETTMVLKVDLHCSRCCKKLKKILSKFPQVRDQIYSKKENTVTISVVSCDPEKIRDKLCSKGSKVIKTIEIMKPQEPDPEPESESEPELNDDHQAQWMIVPHAPGGYPGGIWHYGVPWNHGYGYHLPHQSYCSCGYGGRYGHGNGHYCDYYYKEETPPICSIM